MKKILVTGASGFIGHYVTHLLQDAGYELRLLLRPDSDRSHLPGQREGVEWAEGDLLDLDGLEAALRGCSTVVHAAAVVSFRKKDRRRLYAVNETGTANLINLSLDLGVERLVYLSSVAALDRTGDGPVTEADRWQEKPAATHYARSKFAAEREIWRGQAEGLSVAALYPSVVLGGGDWKGLSTPKLFREASVGRRIYSSGSGGFVDVRDVAEAVKIVLERNRDGDRFLLNAANLSWREVLSAIARSVAAAEPTLQLRPWQSALAWPLAGLAGSLTGRSPALTRDVHRTAQANYRYDGSLIERETGFEYRNIGATIRETGERFLATYPRVGYM